MWNTDTISNKAYLKKFQFWRSRAKRRNRVCIAQNVGGSSPHSILYFLSLPFTLSSIGSLIRSSLAQRLVSCASFQVLYYSPPHDPVLPGLYLSEIRRLITGFPPSVGSRANRTPAGCDGLSNCRTQCLTLYLHPYQFHTFWIKK